MARPPAALRGLRIAVNTQTPLVRFHEGTPTPDEVVPLDALPADTYKFTTGGVTRMLAPLLSHWRGHGAADDASWVALGSLDVNPIVKYGGVVLSFVGMGAEEKVGYAKVKEQLWALLNSNPSARAPTGAEGLPAEAWDAFDRYQVRSAEALRQAAERMGGADLLYVHDFQQMGVAQAWEGPPVPRLFHLHTPFPTGLAPAWRDYVVGNLSRYDAVIVSTHRYAANLRAAGLDAPLHVIPPFIDPADYPVTTSAEVDAFRERHGIAPSDRVILNVGRMDPMKGQDRLVRAMPAVLREVPEARLVLVGNGSFSSSKRGGLGLSKGQQWRASLEALARRLRVEHRVTFTGHLDERMLPAAYSACDVFCLPSTREGFGLAAVEAWRYERPVVVSDRTGIAEFVSDGDNGRVLDCADPAALARTLVDMLRRPDEAAEMGRQGRKASEVATLPVGRRALEDVFVPLLEGRPLATL